MPIHAFSEVQCICRDFVQDMYIKEGRLQYFKQKKNNRMVLDFFKKIVKAPQSYISTSDILQQIFHSIVSFVLN